MTGVNVAWLIVGWIAGVLTTTSAMFVWSLIIDSREEHQ